MSQTDPHPSTLAILETAIRNSVLSESFSDTESLLAGYSAEVERVLRSTPPSAETVQELRRRTAILFEWTAAMVQASREYASSQLTQLQLLSQYRGYADSTMVQTEG